LGVSAVCGGSQSYIKWVHVATPSYLTAPDDNQNPIAVNISESAQFKTSSEMMVNVYPNPFRDKSIISYNLISDSKVTVFVSDATGRQVALLADNEPMTAGTHESILYGNELTSGVYYCTVIAGEYKSVQKIILMK